MIVELYSVNLVYIYSVEYIPMDGQEEVQHGETEEEAADRILFDHWWNSLKKQEKKMWLKRHRELRDHIRFGGEMTNIID
ncbi:hypothetical protein [Hymenobacter sp. YC55]|uniref:hypothetical protein n=1 Tax=Hymenobacter sp. YC55 TaxID=3034019 RepID=UPI0023F67D1A|nr:hypothetical protein [Hymenobacter sp. YC55]